MPFNRQPTYPIRQEFNGALIQPHLFHNSASGGRPTLGTNDPAIRGRNEGFARFLVRSSPTQDEYAVQGHTGDITVFLVGGISGTGGYTQRVMSLVTSGGTERFWLGENSNDRMTVVTTPSGGGTVSIAASGSGADSVGVHVWIARLSGTSLTWWKNGVQVGSATQAANNWSDVTGFRVGSTVFLGGADGWVINAGYERRAWSDAEILDYTNNPFRLWSKTPDLILVDSGTVGPVTHDTSGNLTGSESTIVGSASSATERPSSGVLTGQSSTVSGVAARTRQHNTTGALEAGQAIIVGSSARTRQHPASGNLNAGEASIAGSANRIRVFTSTGALTGQNSVVVGSAERTGSATSHDTSGALVGQNAIIVGSAARVAAPVTHNTSGVLTGQGSIINGVASGSGFADTHDGFWANQWKKAAEREKKKAEKIEQIYENLQEIEEQLEEVKEKPAKTIKVNRNTLTLPPIDAKIQLIEKLIIQRQKILQQIEEEELLLL